MEDHIRLIKAHYSHNLQCTVNQVKLSQELRSKLYDELKESGYSLKNASLTDFLSTCDLHYTYKTDRCTIHIVCPFKEVPAKLLVLRVARRVQCLLDIYKVSKHLIFWLIPSPHLRKFPRNQHTLISPEHINGGFTYSRINNIFVFRQEEFPKVFLHETLHHANIDTHALWDKRDLQKLYTYFRLDTSECDATMQCETTDMRPNEAWIETWAELYQIGFLHIEYGLPWHILWKAEREWAGMQAKRVLMHQRGLHDGKWKENTHAFSYMVLRAALLWCAPEILTIKHARTHEISSLIIRCYDNTSFQQFIQHVPIPNHQSFRMTVFGDL